MSRNIYKEKVNEILTKFFLFDRDIAERLSLSKEYEKVFATKKGNYVNNLEIFEFFGDVLNKVCATIYVQREFLFKLFFKKNNRQRKTMGLLEKMSRITKNFETKVPYSFYMDLFRINEKMITMGRDEKYDKKMKEDMFEAFLGCTHYLLKQMGKRGYQYFYPGIKNLIDMYVARDNKKMSLKFDELFDYKSIIPKQLYVDETRRKEKGMNFVYKYNEDPSIKSIFATIFIDGNLVFKSREMKYFEDDEKNNLTKQLLAKDMYEWIVKAGIDTKYS